MTELIDTDSDTVQRMMGRMSDLSNIPKPCFHFQQYSLMTSMDRHIYVCLLYFMCKFHVGKAVSSVQFCFGAATTLLLGDQCVIGSESLLDLIGCEGR